MGKEAATGGRAPTDKDRGSRATAVFEPSEGFRSALIPARAASALATRDQTVALAPAFGEGVLDDEQAQYTSRTGAVTANTRRSPMR